MTTKFDSFDESEMGGFTESPLHARNRGRGPLWLATRYHELQEDPDNPRHYLRGFIYELSTETLEVMRYARAPTGVVEGIGGDARSIWYVDNKDQRTWGEGEELAQFWQLSPSGLWEGEDVGIVRVGYWDRDIWFWGVGGTSSNIWAFMNIGGGLEPVHRMVRLEPETLQMDLSWPRPPSPIAFTNPWAIGIGGYDQVVFVSGDRGGEGRSTLASCYGDWGDVGRRFNVFHDEVIEQPDNELVNAGFQDVGGSEQQIWAIGHHVHHRNIIYEIVLEQEPEERFRVRRWRELTDLKGPHVANAYEVAFAIGGK